MMLHHVVVHVAHLTPFITLLDAFGFQCVIQTPHDAWIRTPNAFVHLVVDQTVSVGARDFTCAGISHLCIQTPDMRNALAILHAHDVQPLSAPINLGTGHWYVYARLSTGDIIEIEGVPYAPPHASPWLAHVALVSTDAPRLADFYQHLTATTRRGGHMIGPNPRFDTGMQLQHARMMPIWLIGMPLSLEFWQFFTPATRPNPTVPFAYREIGFVTSAIADDCQQAVARGATCIAQYPHSAQLSDPDGNVCTLIHPAHLAPALQHHPDPDIIARINAAWQPLDPHLVWEE